MIQNFNLQPFGSLKQDKYRLTIRLINIILPKSKIKIKNKLVK